MSPQTAKTRDFDQLERRRRQAAKLLDRGLSPGRTGKAGEGQSRERSPLGESDRCKWCRGRTEEGGPRRQNCQTGTAGTGETGADPAGWAGEVRVSQWSLD